MITQKEKDLTIALLTEKLERISGKKIVLEDNLFSSIDTPESLKSEILKEKQADIQTVKDLLKQYSTDIKEEDSGKVSGRAIGKDLYLLSHVVIEVSTNEIYERVFKSVTDLEIFLKPKVLASRIQCSNTKGIKSGIIIGLEYKKLLSDKKQITEETQKWEVIFSDSGDNEVVVSEKFNSKEEAEDWADALQYDFQDEWYNPEHEDYEFKTFYRYYNPEDKESNYVSYEVRPVEQTKQKLTEAKEKTEFKSVVGIIFMGDYVVLGKALTQDDRNGKLVFPGGGIEEGETLEEACKREVFEESGLFVKVRKSKPIVLKDLPTVAFLLCDYSYGSLFFNEEYSEIGWYPLSDLPMNKIYKNNLEILENLKKNSK